MTEFAEVFIPIRSRQTYNTLDERLEPVPLLENLMARQGKLRIESLGELKKTLSDSPTCEFGLLVRDERKVEMEIDKKVIAELLKLLQKVVGNRDHDDDY